MFYHFVSHSEKVWKQNESDEPQMDHPPESQQPTLDEIWEWLGNPDEY